MDEDLKRLIVDTNTETRRLFEVVAERLRQELGAATAGLRQESVDTRRHFDVVAAELRQDFDVVATDLRQENVDTRQHFDAVAADLQRENVDTRRHFDVVAEGLRHDLKGVAEGHLAVSETVDRLTEEMNDRFSETSAELNMVTEAVGRLDTRVVKLETKVDRLETSVERVISILQSENSGVIARLDKLESRR